MLSQVHRKIIIRAAIPAAILLYFSPICLLAYLLVGLGGILIWRRSPEKMANFFTNMATVVVTLLILAVLLEIGLHLKPHFFIGNQDPDTLGDFADFTSRGYLTEEVFNKPPGAFRIMSLGDSFAVYPPGNNPKLNYNHILAEKFATLGPGRVDLVNFGMPAVGPGYYWHILERYGERVSPDLVMVGFFLGNDFEEWEMKINLGNYLTEPLSLKGKLRSYSQFRKWRLYYLIKRKYLWFRESLRRSQAAHRNGEPDHGTFSRETFLDIEWDRSWNFQKQGRAALDQNWRQCAKVIGRMKQWCDARNVELVLVIFPDQFQVDGDLRTEVLKTYNIPSASLDLEYPNSLLTGYCQQNHIHCLDLLPRFQAEGKSRALYVVRDSHWNEAGNRLAAELIFKYLTENNLIKSQ